MEGHSQKWGEEEALLLKINHFFIWNLDVLNFSFHR